MIIKLKIVNKIDYNQRNRYQKIDFPFDSAHCDLPLKWKQN